MSTPFQIWSQVTPPPMNPESLSNITVSSDDLLRILKENLEAHNEVFNASTQAYYETLRAELEGKKEQAETLVKTFAAKLENVTTVDPSDSLGDYYHIFTFKAKKPVSYESHYTSAIRKVELSQRKEFSLSDSEFQRYILNNWEWKADFINNATTYLNSSIGAASGILLSGINKFNK